MSRNGEPDMNLQVLRRIAVLLITLAGLCERFATATPAARQAMLFLFRPCARRARRFITGYDQDFSVPYVPGESYTPDDALILADRFRELAHWLLCMLEDKVFGWGGMDFYFPPLPRRAAMAVLMPSALPLAICSAPRHRSGMDPWSRHPLRSVLATG